MDGILRVNTHGLNIYKARIQIDSQLRKAGSGIYRIRIIHGYNLGTEIKEMVREEYRSHNKVKRICSGTNDGETDLVLREF